MEQTFVISSSSFEPVDSRMRGASEGRMSKEQYNVLEAHFLMDQRPRTVVKRQLADQLGVSIEKVNNWFQNRRSRSRLLQKKALHTEPMEIPQIKIVPRASEDKNGSRRQGAETERDDSVWRSRASSHGSMSTSTTLSDVRSNVSRSNTLTSVSSSTGLRTPSPPSPYEISPCASEFSFSKAKFDEDYYPIEPSSEDFHPSDASRSLEASPFQAEDFAGFEFPALNQDFGYLAVPTAPWDPTFALDNFTAFASQEKREQNNHPDRKLARLCSLKPDDLTTLSRAMQSSSPASSPLVLLANEAGEHTVFQEMKTPQVKTTGFRYNAGVLFMGDSPLDQKNLAAPVSPVPRSADLGEGNYSSEDTLSPWSDASELLVEWDENVSKLRDSAVDRLVARFYSSRQRKTGQSTLAVSTGSEPVSSSLGSKDTASTSSSQRKSKGKRKLGDDFNPQDSDNDDDQVTPTRPRLSSFKDDEERRLLACPFCKWKPLEYRNCYKYVLKEISRLKQHLWRCHRIPIHCPSCNTEFANTAERDAHIRLRNCQVCEVRRWEGITEEQKQKLKRRVDARKSQKDQWYDIYDVLFPGETRPESPYVEELLSEELRAFRDFVAAQGPAVVNELVQTYIPEQLRPHDSVVRAFASTLFQHAVPDILRRFEAGRASSGNGTDASPADSGYISRTDAGQTSPAATTVADASNLPTAPTTATAALNMAVSHGTFGLAGADSEMGFYPPFDNTFEWNLSNDFAQ